MLLQTYAVFLKVCKHYGNFLRIKERKAFNIQNFNRNENSVTSATPIDNQMIVVALTVLSATHLPNFCKMKSLHNPSSVRFTYTL